MRVFISEFVCGGGWPEAEIAGSLATEGRAILRAVIADFARVAGVKVTTTWDARLGPFPQASSSVHAIVVDSPDDELPIFRELADLSNATLVIAPETHALLEQRCQIVEGTRGRLLGPASSAVRLCTSKLDTVRRLEQRGVRTVATAPMRLSRLSHPEAELTASSTNESLAFPLVVKPNDGAGSQSTWLIRDEAEFDRMRPALAADPLLLTAAIWQPYIKGRAVSVGVLISADGERIEPLPPAEQTLSENGRFHYLGGVLPARGVAREIIRETAGDACRAIEGLRGYVGVDLVVPDANPDEPLVIEINPRLTTSYLGYRQLTDANLAERMLNLADAGPIVFSEGPIGFSLYGPIA